MPCCFVWRVYKEIEKDFCSRQTENSNTNCWERRCLHMYRIYFYNHPLYTNHI